MRKLMLAVAFALAAVTAACTDQQKDDTFAIACSAVSTADIGFQLYAGTGKVSQKVIDAEAKAVIGAQAICNGPRPDDVKSALAAVNRALSAIASATQQARVQVGGA